MWLRTGQLANRVQDIALAYRCAVIMPEGGGIWELYHGCYLGYKPNQDIKLIYTVFIRIVAVATINFAPSSVRLLIEGGSYLRAATIYFARAQ